ncbi:MAG: phenylacetate-CoA oxygenase subunit PaaJ [Saprospirales bacterium]|nr:phenylacetate-CoA oxygenase subunit PaaJ [Saprospirales bacterium]MBK8491251.1 phenylacetate-CoA oxygenase subunit PaaJ [Saprospirales bacterium]
MEDKIWTLLESVTDPEIPVLTVVDMGVVREVKAHSAQGVEVVITPTYSGCPAMNTIEMEIKATLEHAGYGPVKVTTVLSPAWTTQWLSEAGRRKLEAYGIAPPVEGSLDKSALFAEEKQVPCPQCRSTHTRMVSQFGSTACKALYQCEDCLEPFDYFKCH